MNRLRILLVDDNQRFLRIAADYLANQLEIEVAGEAHSGLEAVQMVADLSPELVLMDLSMPGMNGLEATRRIKARPMPPQVVIVTMYDGPEFCAFARDAGAEGFVTKAEFVEALLPLIFKLFPRLQIEPAHEIAGTR